jgi:hypothetical protein
MIQNWYEVWVDESPEIPYILFVFPSKINLEEILIIDPKENNQVIKNMPNYKMAIQWLQEDEYTLVNGRMEID